MDIIVKDKIEDILLSRKELEQLEFKIKHYGIRNRAAIIRSYAGGTCCICAGIPSKKISVDIGDHDGQGIKVEYYCDNCYVRLTATNGKDEIIAKKVREKVS